MITAIEDDLKLVEDGIRRYEASISRLDKEDPEEIESEEYETILDTLVRLREKREVLLKRMSEETRNDLHP